MFPNVILVSLFFVSGFSVEVVVKRSDIDLQTCIDNFDIHKDKIIRTQDSKTMGAKYLNEIDLDSREECLRLCCETDNCDVFVYEEKNAGSCYLFQCGPPEDFKCKFTHHVNYTSAVLAVNRHLPDLESQIKLTKHEQDLTKLRTPEAANTGNVQLAPAQTTQSSTTTTTIPKDEAKTKTPNENKKCSIYQFECRSTGECIGIYNVCDSIPQCADGSDEAPELKCPGSTTTLAPVQNHVGNTAPEVAIVPPENQAAQYVPMVNSQTQEMYRQQMLPPHLSPKIQPVQRQDSDFLRPVPDSGNVPPPQYEPPQIPQYPQYLPQQNNWLQRQPNQLPPQMPQFPEKNSHIFNHKENGLQVADVGEGSQMQYGDAREYPKLANYYGGEMYGQQQMQENWPHNQHDYRVGSNLYQPEMTNGGRETWSQNVPVQDVKEKYEYKTPLVKELPANWKIEKAIPKHEQDKMAHELKHSKQQFEVPTDKDDKSVKHTANDGHDHGKYSVVAEYKIAAGTLEAIEDGVAETPGGAVLSLTLGLILTTLMGILIGCRLRVVRRRLRRGGKSYAHDADYLVNGMYL